MLKKYYHGSFNNDIHSFWPLSHFGTYQAALECVNNAQKWRSNADIRACSPTDNSPLEKCIYEVEIDFTNTCSVQAKDLGSPRPGGILLGIQSFNNDLIKDLDKAIKQAANLVEKNEFGGQRLKHSNAREFVQSFLSGKKIDYVSYINDVEDKGSESIVLVNTTLIKSIILIEKIV